MALTLQPLPSIGLNFHHRLAGAILGLIIVMPLGSLGPLCAQSSQPAQESAVSEASRHPERISVSLSSDIVRRDSTFIGTDLVVFGVVENGELSARTWTRSVRRRIGS